MFDSYTAPKDAPAIVELARSLFPLLMRVKHGSVAMRIVGDGLSRFQKLKGKRVVICPNHSSEYDAEVVFGLSCLVKEKFYYLTAHEIFHGNRGWNGLVLPALGCYSISRGLKDVSAYKMTRSLIVDNKRKLVAFPEGEVSHLNETVMPLERGVVQMSFAALNVLDVRKVDGTVYVLPVAIKYLFLDNVEQQLKRKMTAVETRLGLSTVSGQSLSSRVRLAVVELISQLEARYDARPWPDMRFAERVNTLRWRVLQDVAGRLAVDIPEYDRQLECAHALKSMLCDRFFHQAALRKDRNRQEAKLLKELYRDVLCVIHLIAVEDSFVGLPTTQVSQEQTAEVVQLLENALRLKDSSPGRKMILLDIGEPIDLRNFQAAYKSDKVATVLTINNMIRDELLSMLSRFDLDPPGRESNEDSIQTVLVD